jgi:hypothetical protein
VTSPLPDFTMNQPLKHVQTVREIERQAWKLTYWEWNFMGPVRKKIILGIKLNEYEDNKINQIAAYLVTRKDRLPESDDWKKKPYKPKASKEFYAG